MKLTLRLAWRNLWRNRRRTLLVVLAMAMMMSFLIMYDSMIFGFESAVYGNAIKLSGGNIQIRAVGYEDSYSPNPMLPMGNGLDAVQAAEANHGCWKSSCRAEECKADRAHSSDWAGC